jgi:cytochrome c biogenesis protein ResB
MMDFQFVLEEYHPSSLPKAEYFALDSSPQPGTESEDVVNLQLGKENLWLELGSSGQVPMNDALYYVQYTKRAVDFGFDLKLTEFHIGYYEGTEKPMTYASDVEFQGKKQTISMNEPLHHNGYTFYQSSYETDQSGEPKFSVLSVNLDPGRRIKYLGSLMIVLGIISMFYFKPIYSGRSKWLAREPARTDKQEGMKA